MRHRFILILAIGVSITGCQALLSVDVKQPVLMMRDRERLPSDAPTATVTSDPGASQWTVSVRQPYRITTETLFVQAEGVRRYLWWPLAPLTGLLQCPVGVIGAGLSDAQGWKTIRQIGCMRLVGLEPLKSVAERHHHVIQNRHEEEEIAPVPGAAVTFVPRDGAEDTLRTVTDRDGTVSLTYKALNRTINTPLSGRVTVDGYTGRLLSQHIVLTPPKRSPDSLHSQRLSFKADEEVIVRVDPFTTSQGTEIPSLQSQLITSLLNKGMCVVAGEAEQTTVAEEVRLQEQRASDSSAVKMGRLLVPTIIIHGVLSESANGSEIAVKLYQTRTGEQLILRMDGTHLDEAAVFNAISTETTTACRVNQRQTTLKAGPPR
jgi:hypothetical protein